LHFGNKVFSPVFFNASSLKGKTQDLQLEPPQLRLDFSALCRHRVGQRGNVHVVGVQRHSRGNYNEGCAGCVHGSGGLFGYLATVSTQLVQATINRSSPLSIGSRSNVPSESVHSIYGVRRFAKLHHREIATRLDCASSPVPPPYKCRWYRKQIHRGVLLTMQARISHRILHCKIH
jgi:hypothetical protein